MFLPIYSINNGEIKLIILLIINKAIYKYIIFYSAEKEIIKIYRYIMISELWYMHMYESQNSLLACSGSILSLAKDSFSS